MNFSGHCEHCGEELVICFDGDTVGCVKCALFWWVSSSGQLTPRILGETPAPTDPEASLQETVEKQKRMFN